MIYYYVGILYYKTRFGKLIFNIICALYTVSMSVCDIKQFPCHTNNVQINTLNIRI